MQATIRSIVDFVEGTIDAKEFEQRLYSDPMMEVVLNDDPILERGTYVGTSVYLFVIEQDFNSPAGRLNAHGTLARFLARKGIEFRPTSMYSNQHRILIDAQPRWLAVPADWIQTHVIPLAEGRTGKALKEWLKSRLLELFKYSGKPPKWIQSPAWPIGENGPLVFLGQLKIPDYFHDYGAAYVFHDPVSGRFETVVQVM